jgi:uncharacterized protein with HEPN domain
MSDRNEKLLLEDIVQSIKQILIYTHEMSFEAFINSQITVDAVIRNFEVMGEASSRLPQSFKNSHPQIPFRKIKDFRNKVIHFYFGIDYNLVWDTIQTELKPLLENLIIVQNNLPKTLFDKDEQ